MSRPKLYIAGPMSGLPEWNYPAFLFAEDKLREAGFDILKPARNPAQDCWEGYMRAAIAQVIQADGIAYLPGSKKSRGATLELHIAKELGMETKPVRKWLP